LIIYGYIADVSIGRLFIGGVVPGLLAASLMAVTSAGPPPADVKQAWHQQMECLDLKDAPPS
jgi:TRAP-type C4-dicarboxylate transport system permease large subunit